MRILHNNRSLTFSYLRQRSNTEIRGHGAPAKDSGQAGAETGGAARLDVVTEVMVDVAPVPEQLRSDPDLDQAFEQEFNEDEIRWADLIEDQHEEPRPRLEEVIEHEELETNVAERSKVQGNGTVNPFVDSSDTDSGDEELELLICDVKPFLQNFSNNSVDIKGIYIQGVPKNVCILLLTHCGLNICAIDKTSTSQSSMKLLKGGETIIYRKKWLPTRGRDS